VQVVRGQEPAAKDFSAVGDKKSLNRVRSRLKKTPWTGVPVHGEQFWGAVC
jgi:hypothetical protein